MAATPTERPVTLGDFRRAPYETVARQATQDATALQRAVPPLAALNIKICDMAEAIAPAIAERGCRVVRAAAQER